MKKTKQFLAGLVAIAASSTLVAADIQDVLTISKMTGVCGVMQQMAAFQMTTGMDGGAVFIERFWRTEFARLGKSQEQFIKECESSIAIYESLWATSNK